MIPRVIPGVAMAVCCVMPSPRRCGRRRVSPSIESKMDHVAEAVAAVKRNLSTRVDGGISGGTGLRSGRIDAPAGIGSLVIFELFNLARDVAETTDLSAAEPDKVKELAAKLDVFSREAVPPILKPAVAKKEAEGGQPAPSARSKRDRK